MDLVSDITDAVPSFDLEKENIHGVISNLTLLSFLLNTLTKDRPFPKTKPTIKPSYDYIIVGGGTAGSVMAYRLSQKPCVNVLLLEAGAEAPLLTDIPSLARLFYETSIDWSYKSEPQKHGAFNQKENRVPLNSGKVFGGGSVLNAMLYVRGNKKDYDNWEKEGATGWSYKDVLPYFIKLEDNRDIGRLDPGYHQQGGPMTAEGVNYVPDIKNPILEATADMGFKVIDINGEHQTGIYDIQATVRDQQRCSTAKAYLVPAEDRPNLDIVKDAFVTKIILKNKKAIGVEVEHSDQTVTVRANKEVVISAGSIRTPQLLMLAGIGPKEELKKFNIDVVADLPVGKNLQDHYETSLIYQLDEAMQPLILHLLSPESILDYALHKRGVLAAPNQVTLLAFLDGLNTTSSSDDYPKLELYFAEYATIDAKLNYNLKDEVYDKFYGPYELKPLYYCLASLLRPESVGEVTLSSTDPHDFPRINPNYYEDERDLDVVVEAMKVCQAVAKHPAMRKVKARPVDTVFPGCEESVGNEDEYFRCYARHLIHSAWHYVGTARMGQPDDPRSVVDPTLRVIGIKNLRVVNAAVMPKVPSGNTNVPTMMVAEKAYDMMKDDIQCSGNRKIRKSNRKCHN